MAAQEGYVDVSRPGLLPLLKYPPGYPLTIAPFVDYVGPHLKWLRLVSMLPFLLSIPLLYKLLRYRISQASTLLIVTLHACHPVSIWGLEFLNQSGIHTLVLYATLIVTAQVLSTGNPPQQPQQQQPHRTPIISVLSLGVLLAAGFYIHRMMLCLVALVPIYLSYHRQTRQALIALGVAGCLIAPWFWRSHIYSGHWMSPEYEYEFADRIHKSAPQQPPGIAVIEHIRLNMPKLPTELGLNVLPWSHLRSAQRLIKRLGLPWILTVSAWAISLLILLGFVHECRRQATLTEWYMICQILLLLIYFVSFKYFSLFIPWLLLYLGRGVEVIIMWLKPSMRKQMLWTGGGAALLLMLAVDKIYWGQRSWPGTNERDARWSWVTATVPAGETVYWLNVSNYATAPWRYFDTQRMAIGITETELISQLNEKPSKIGYLMIPTSSSLKPKLVKLGWRLMAQESPGKPAQLSDSQALWTRKGPANKVLGNTR